MWQLERTPSSTSSRHSLVRRSVSSSSSISSDDISIFSAREARSSPRLVPAASTNSPTPLTSRESSFNAGADQHGKQHQEDAGHPLYPDLSDRVGMIEEQHSWSSAWVNLEMPGEEESRVWGDGYPSTESVQKFHPCPQPPVIQKDGNSSAAPHPQARRDEEEFSFETDSTDDYDEFDGGGVTLDFDDTEEIRPTEVAEVTGAEVVEVTGQEVAVLESSVQETDTEIASSAIFTADSEEDYDGDDDIDTLLQGT